MACCLCRAPPVLFPREQVLLLPLLHPGGGGLVLRCSVRCRPPVGLGRVRGRALRHGVLHQLARPQPKLCRYELHRLPVPPLLHRALHRHLPVIRLHPPHRPGLPTGCAAARVPAEQDHQRTYTYREGNQCEPNITSPGEYVHTRCILNFFLFLSAVGGGLHWLPDSMESVRHRVHVGGIWQPRHCPTDGVCPGSHLCQVLHPLQPYYLLGLQAQLPQVLVSGRGPVQEITMWVSVSAEPSATKKLRAIPPKR